MPQISACFGFVQDASLGTQVVKVGSGLPRELGEGGGGGPLKSEQPEYVWFG